MAAVLAGLLTQACAPAPVQPASAPRPASTVPPTSAASHACQLPVSTTSRAKGGTLGGGFVDLPDATYETDPGSDRAYDATYGRWLPVDPQLVAPDGESYVERGSDGRVVLVDVASGSRRPISAQPLIPRLFTTDGIYAGYSSSGAATGLALLRPNGVVDQIAGPGRAWNVLGPDAAWGYANFADPSQTIYRLGYLDRAVVPWYRPPAGIEQLFMLGVDPRGRLLVMFRGSASTPWRAGLITERDTLLDVAQPPELRSARGYGDPYTDSEGLWLGVQGVGVVRYAPDTGLRMVSPVPANALRVAGSCVRLTARRLPAVPTPSPTAAQVTAPQPPQPPPQPPPPPTPPLFKVGVPVYRQQSSLSCEEAVLSMVLAFYGHPATEQQVFDQVGIDRAHYWAGRSGGGDPYAQFVGDPNGSEVQQTGYGVYWTPIAGAAKHFGAPVAQAGEGIAPAAIYAAVRGGHPAVVWVTYDLRPHVRADYQAFDGRTVPYAGPYEHAMVVTGLNDTGVRVNDPDAGQYWVPFGQFEAAYAVYNRMAVVFA